MLTTKNIKLKEGEIPGSVKVVSIVGDGHAVTEFDTSKPNVEKRTRIVPPKVANLDPDRWGGINKRETKKTLGSMLTTANYKERVEASKPKPVKKRRARRKKK